MTDFSGYTMPEIIWTLGRRFKVYRLRARMTQKEVSDWSGITIATISRFESAQLNNISMANFLLLMKAVNCLDYVDKALPDLSMSPYLYDDNDNMKQRVRHTKNERE